MWHDFAYTVRDGLPERTQADIGHSSRQVGPKGNAYVRFKEAPV
jgi:hypothetical protein